MKHENASRRVLLQAEEIKADTPNAGQWFVGLRLALDIQAPNQIFVRGRGVDAELGGSLGVTGTSAAPVVSGAFK